ncbi:MAG: HAD family hydrolase [Candidatus Heimdallarchaeota archaeon]|nr:HAD family hydrolase [Candidatus Heimdallarchaeota archaeon]MBY8994244.1 HAD family hydrolase [Candidatus Heimdallarchaeota archaeon]
MTITTILFDMDSTLNSIDEIEFSRKYFKMLHERFFSEFELQFFYDSLTNITKNVMLSRSPRELAIKTFMKEMAKCYKKPQKKLYEDFKEFYATDYNQLEEFVRPAEGAQELVQTCFNKGYDVIIATTPVFTEDAIMRRLKWSGMAEFTFELVTHAENMHFSKPLEEYYTEILKKTKKKYSECIMVGNEFMGDIVSPTRIGLKTFYIPLRPENEDLFVSPELKRFSKIKPTYQGTLTDLTEIVKSGFLNLD